METFENFRAFTDGINQQLDNMHSPVPPASSHDLLPEHHELLIELNRALVLLKSSPSDALESWHLIKPKLLAAVDAGKEVAGDAGVNSLESLLSGWTEKEFVGAAYHSAEEQAEAHVESPDAGLHEAEFKKAEQEFLEADKLWEDSTKVMSMAATKATGVQSVQDIVEIVKMPGTIAEKLAAAKKMPALGQLSTVVDLVGKIQGATKQVLSVIGEIGERYCKGLASVAAAKSSHKLAEELTEEAERWHQFGEAAKALAKGATIAALVGDGIALLQALEDGDWEGAVGATANIGVDAAPLVFGEEVAGPLALLVVGAKVELGLLHEWAQIIRAINDEKVREATRGFVGGLIRDVYPNAKKLIGDTEVMLDASQAAEVREAAEAQVADDAIQTWDGVKSVVQRFLGPLEKYDAVYYSLGPDALAALDVNGFEMPVSIGKDLLIPQAVIDRVQKIFHGANLMGAYVKANYTHGE